MSPSLGSQPSHHVGFAAHSSQVSPSLSTKPGKSTHVSSGIGVDVVGTGVVVLVVGSPASPDVPFVLFLGGGVVGTTTETTWVGPAFKS